MEPSKEHEAPEGQATSGEPSPPPAPIYYPTAPSAGYPAQPPAQYQQPPPGTYPTQPQVPNYPYAQAVYLQPKDKTVAVLLAIFLSFWTWVYTYRRDSGKFWLNLALSVVTLGFWGLLVAWPWSIIDAAVKPQTYYRNYPQG